MAERTTMTVHKDVHERLEELKPHDSMSFNELLEEMAKMAEQDDSSRDSVEESGENQRDVICPND